MTNARDTSAMDTLPLNGNFNNSYSLRNGDYGDSVQVVDCGLGLDDAAFEKMIISELVHNNLRACGKSHRSESRINTKKATGADGSGQDNVIVAETSSLVHLGTESNHIVGGLSLQPQFHHHTHNPHHHHHHTHNPHHPRELEAPLIPQRTHSLLYHTQERGRPEPAALLPPHSYATQLPAQLQAEDSLQSPRDSLYASLPNLTDSPSVENVPDMPEDLSPSKQSESEDVYYKSMPNLGASSQQLHAYYQISRGSSDGYIIPPITKEDSIPEGDVREGQMQLVTSL